jgi:hypothetical protein
MAQSYTVAYQYDDVSNITSITYPDQCYAQCMRSVLTTQGYLPVWSTAMVW